MNNIPELSANRSECTIDEITLKVDQNVDYKSATDRRTSIGKILKFMYAGWQQSDRTSVWMLIKDIQESSTEWVSVHVWKCQYDKGHLRKPKVEANVTSQESPAAEGYPF